MGEGKVHHNGCEPPDPVWPAQEHWHAHQPRPEAGIPLVSRVHKVPQWERENLRHLHGQKVIAGGSRASVRQLDALLDLPTPYIDTCSQASSVFGLWFTIIYNNWGVRVLVQVEGVLQGVAPPPPRQIYQKPH